MWPTNDFHGHGGYQSHMEAGNYQHNFTAGDGFIPFLPDGTDQHFPPQLSQMRPSDGDEDSYMQGNFQPEVGRYNDRQFMHNSFYENDSMERSTTQLPSGTPQTASRPGPGLDARTRELKAKLMEGMAQRAQSGTPPSINAAISKPSNNGEGNSSLRQSPITPVGKSPSTEVESLPATAEDVEDLLSQHRPTAKNSVELQIARVMSSFRAAEHQRFKSSNIPLKDNALTPVKLTNLSHSHNIQLSKAPNGKLDKILKNGEGFDGDEGEISDDRNSIAATSRKDIVEPSNLQLAREHIVSNTPMKEIVSNSQSPHGLGTSPKLLRSPVQNSRAPSRHQNERYDLSEGRLGGQNFESSDTYEQKPQQYDERNSQKVDNGSSHPMNNRKSRNYNDMKSHQMDERHPRQMDEQRSQQNEERRSHQVEERMPQQKAEPISHQIDERISQKDHERRPQRDYEPKPTSHRTLFEDPREHEIRYDSVKLEVAPRKQDIPTLAQLLAFDEDLKEWLEITGYHNTEYRSKTLNRRRALAALDARRAKMDAERKEILEELEREERGGGLLAGTAATQSLPTPMLPPQFPNKSNDPLPKPLEAPTRENAESVLKLETGTKRDYQDYRDSPDFEDKIEKNARLDEEGCGFRTKGEHSREDQRRSSVPNSRADRQGDSESSNQIEDHSRGRRRDSDREISPGLQAFNDRPPARTTSHGWFETDESRDHDGSRERNDTRPYVVIGNYRGRDFDPNYRGRGRGRGNWVDKHNDRDQNNGQSSQKPQPPHQQQQQQPHQTQHQQHRSPEQWRMYGQRIANSPARKGLIKWDKGGKGGQ